LQSSQEYKPEKTSSLTVKLTAPPLFKLSSVPCVPVHYATYATLQSVVNFFIIIIISHLLHENKSQILSTFSDKNVLQYLSNFTKQYRAVCPRGLSAIAELLVAKAVSPSNKKLL